MFLEFVGIANSYVWPYEKGGCGDSLEMLFPSASLPATFVFTNPTVCVFFLGSKIQKTIGNKISINCTQRK